MKVRYRITKRPLALLLVLMLTISLLPVNAFATTGAKDIDGHPAASAIETCRMYGIMNGIGNGYYKPNAAITRAEFATMVNRAFGYDTLNVPKLTGYTDVQSNKWYVNEVATIVAMGYMVGYGGGRFGPEDTLSWEQAGIVLGKILRLDGSYPTDKTGTITRGEMAQLFVDVFGVIVDESHDAKSKQYKNVTIRKPGVRLTNANITGDLFITEGVGDGDVWLDTVRIDGRLLAAGGGENSIHVNDITVGENVVVDKPSVAGEEPVRFRAIQTGDNTVIFQGTAREVIITDDIIIIIDNDGEKTVFNMFKPEDGATKPTVVISEGATVDKIVAAIPVAVSGGGNVNKIEAQTEGVEIAAEVLIRARDVEATGGVQVKIGEGTMTGTGIANQTTITPAPSDKTPTPAPTPVPTTPPSGGGNGNNGGGSQTTYYSITFNANGGSGSMSAITSISSGSTRTLTANAFTRTSHTFAGWATSAAGSVVYADGASITVSSNITLYAVWTQAAPMPNATVSASVSNVNPTAGTPNTVTFTVKTSTGATDTAFTGNHTVTVSGIIGTAADNALNTTYTVNFAYGVGTLNLAIQKAAAHTVAFNVAGVTAPNTGTVTITPVHAALASLSITTATALPLRNGTNAVTLTTNPQITLLDQYGNICTSDSATAVTMSVETGTVTLDGSKTVAASNGVAAFAALTLAANSNFDVPSVVFRYAVGSITVDSPSVPFNATPTYLTTIDKSALDATIVTYGAAHGTTTFTIQNTGNTQLTDLVVAISNTTDFTLANGGSIGTLAAGASKTVTITPKSTITVNNGTPYTTSLTVTSALHSSANSEENNLILTVNHKAVTITGLSASNKIYDGGTAATVTGTAVISGKVGSDNVTLITGTATFADKTAANGKIVTFSGYSLIGSAADNYNLTGQPANVTANITPLQLTIAAPSGSPTKVYDGGTAYTGGGITPGSLSNKIGVDAVNVTVSSYTYNAKDVASANAIIIVYAISGTDAGNYTAPVNGSISGTITKANPTVTAWPTGLTATYGQTLSAVSITGGTATPTGTFTWTTPTSAVGLAGMQSNSMTFTPSDTANYSTATQNVGVTVSPKPVTITGFSITKTYNGTNAVSNFGTLSFSGLVGSETAIVNTSGVIATYATATVGTGITVTTSGNFTMSGGTAGVGNYIVTQPSGLTGAITLVTPSAPNAPTSTVNTDVTVTLTAPSSGDTLHTNLAMEYSRSNSGQTTSNGTWQPGLTFSGLTKSTTYYFFARYKADATKNSVSGSSPSLSVTTDALPAQDGSAANPFQVYDAVTLQKVGSGTDGWTLSAHYLQTSNIDMVGQTFTAIGAQEAGFTGSYDGGGVTISNLSINKSSFDYQGLFGSIDTGGVVKNVGLAGGSVSGKGSVGGIAGNNNGTVQNCYNTGTVTGSGNLVGGVAGANYGTVQNCYATGNVTGIGYAGGVAGMNGGTVQNCYATGNVTASDAGGVAGESGGTVQNCYATGAVSGLNYVGGVVGDVGANGKIRNCVALNPSVTTTSALLSVGRVSGNTGGSLTNNYAFGGMTVQNSDGAVTPTSNLNGKDGADLSAATMKTNAFWTTATNWNVNAGATPPAFAWDFTSATPIWAWTADKMPHLTATDLWDWPAYLVDQGDGTQGSPFKVYDAVTLQKVGTEAYGAGKWHIVAYYEQIANIDMVGQAFTAIGTSSAPFNGTYNGGGHIIQNLTINKPTTDNQGLFGYVGAGGVVKNVGLVGGSIIGMNNVGGIVGYNMGTVQNSYATGNVTGNNNVGGVVGESNGSTAIVQNCYTTGNVSGLQGVGGVVGENYSGSTVQNCYATGVVSGSTSVGGVVGFNFSSKVRNCVALNPSVTATSALTTVGRVVGGEFGTLTNNYAFGGMAVTGSGYVADIGLSKKDGADLTAATMKTNAFWTTSTNWNTTSPAFAWDFASTWVWDDSDNYMPHLKNSGAQAWPDDLVDDPGTFSLPLNIAAITVTAEGGGTVEAFGLEDGYTFVDETVTVIATLDEGWTFSHWQDENGEIVSYDAEYMFIVMGDITLTAVCVEDTALPIGDEAETPDDDRKEPDAPEVPDDNDEETPDPDDDGNGSDDDSQPVISGVAGDAQAQITPQQAIQTLNNLLAYCGSVTGR